MATTAVTHKQLIPQKKYLVTYKNKRGKTRQFVGIFVGLVHVGEFNEAARWHFYPVTKDVFELHPERFINAVETRKPIAV